MICLYYLFYKSFPSQFDTILSIYFNNKKIKYWLSFLDRIFANLLSEWRLMASVEVEVVIHYKQDLMEKPAEIED